jgi:hypothetical protein
MNTKFRISILLMLSVLFAISSCKKEDAFDFNAISPLVSGLSGEATFPSVKGSEHAYKVTVRGGSTYAWEVIEGGDIVSVATESETYKAKLTVVKEVSVSSVVKITVAETTHGGLVSEKDTLEILVTPYVAVDLDAFTGTYTEYDVEEDVTGTVTITRDPDDELFGLIITGIMSEDWWFGEPGGVLKIKLYGVDKSVNFAKQETGIVYGSYGAVSMSLTGGKRGSFDLATKTITFMGSVTVAAGSFGDYTWLYTPAK